MAMTGARVWAERIRLPTYGVGDPDPNPMFLEKRVYQGSSGAVYPYPVIDRVADTKSDREYQAVFLENRWIRVMVLPELGGRVHSAIDKTNGYRFVYHNQVIKPALVGLAGPWLSGGIEFNWPQHHRPNTYGPVEWRIVRNADGTSTLWCSEIDRMARTKGMHGFTIRPDRAALEIRVRLFNRTSEPQTFLWWANPAVHVNDDYQSVFPQDVRAVMDHGKRDVSEFPIAKGTYYKVNYAPGTDISRYRNIPVPTSYMAYKSDFDFLGDWDHGARAGMLHIANHHVAPGKKQWTWGNSNFGVTWDRQLTDEDGPYIELMCGGYTDNQPDFSWLMPGEEKAFTQHFLPYQAIGPAKNASIDAAVNLEVEGRQARLGVYVTGPRKRVRIRLSRGTKTLFTVTTNLEPARAFLKVVTLSGRIPAHHLTLSVTAADGTLLVSYTPLAGSPHGVPSPAQPIPPPAEVPTAEQLLLAGQHLEQYRHATREPQPYYEEALRRDPGDARNHNALGLLLYRRGRFVDAETHFRAAIARTTARNPNPYDGEPHYNLGLALRMQGKFDAAFDAFYKAVWSDAWQAAGYFELARIACRRESWDEALDLLDRSLAKNTRNHRARQMLAAVYRRQRRFTDARRELKTILDRDPLDFGAHLEIALMPDRKGAVTSGFAAWRRATRSDPRNHIELALDYAHAGLWSEASMAAAGASQPTPMTDYYLGWFDTMRGDSGSALKMFRRAAAGSPRFCFPNELECVPALEAALEANPRDGRAPYYLGLFLYARRDHDRAIGLWERSRKLQPGFPTVHRNLGLAYANKRGDLRAARRSFERAFSLDSADARVLFELDQLRKKQGDAPATRLAHLDRYPGLVDRRDDLTVERLALLNRLGRHREALDILERQTFHPWEGGEGKVAGQFVFALLQLARAHLTRGEPRQAIPLLERARSYPPNLGEGKLAGAQENHLNYFLGLAYAATGELAAARRAWTLASQGLSEPASAMFYNDQPPDTIFYQGLALARLGRRAEAQARFRKLVAYGRRHRHDTPAIDYFAISLPDFLVFDEDLTRKNRIHCAYMAGLGFAGLGARRAALRCFSEVLRLEPGHLGAWAARADLG